MGKKGMTKPPPGVYRDDPDRDDAASTSSAVPLDNVDYPDKTDLPPYEDVPSAPRPGPSETPTANSPPKSYLIQPELPSSHLSQDRSTVVTHWPLYSQDAGFLTKMLKDQAQYPPQFTVRLEGTHTETIRKQDNKTEKTNVTDFDIYLDMTHLLIPTPTTPAWLANRDLRTPSPAHKAHRGNRLRTTYSEESAPDAASYIHAYISSSYPVRSFTLTRQIQHYDQETMTALLTSLVNSTNYRGHLSITYPIARNKVTVYSPCWQNTYREKVWLRWFFYLSFLWVFSWPYLWFATRRWEVVTAEFPYSCDPACGNRRFMGRSETEVFEEWNASLRRAVRGRLQGWVDEEYKRATVEEAAARAGSGRLERLPSTESAMADGALGFLRQAVVVGRDVAGVGGWGADS